jgi:hypothetical protein
LHLLWFNVVGSGASGWQVATFSALHLELLPFWRLSRKRLLDHQVKGFVSWGVRVGDVGKKDFVALGSQIKRPLGEINGFIENCIKFHLGIASYRYADLSNLRTNRVP